MSLRSPLVLCAVTAGVLAMAAPAIAQKPTGSAVKSSVPRAPDGRPDLQGVWDFRTVTPLERPDAFATQAQLTAEQAATLEAQAAASFVDRPPPKGSVGGYNLFWFDTRSSAVEDRRTSLIVDPPDGKVPALAPNAKRQVGSLEENRPSDLPIRYRVGGRGYDGPEDRGLAERCLIGYSSGPPMLPGGYNQNVQLFQTSDHVVIVNEMVHDARIIPLDGRPHLPSDLRQWMGDSRGRWDGDTLVVETTNFTSKTASFNPTVTSAIGTGETLNLTERFTRVDARTIRYEYTVNDPATFTKPITAVIYLRKSEEQMFEYACHEGNYGLLNILRGARAEESLSRESR
jgi:hypothetical protein